MQPGKIHLTGTYRKKLKNAFITARTNTPLLHFFIALNLITCTVWLLSAGHCRAGETAVWGFESGLSGWKPSDKTMTVSRSEGNEAPDSGGPFLRIRGTVHGGSTLAISERKPMNGFQHYRISAWVRIDTVTVIRPNPFSNLPVPCIHCEFMTSDTKSSLGVISVSDYSMLFTGQWTRLTGELRAPWGTEFCRLSVVMGTTSWMKPDDMVKMDVSVDTITVEPIPHYTVDEKYRLDPLPQSLEKVRGIHPRIFLNSKKITELRAKTGGEYAHFRSELLSQANELVKSGPPKYTSYDDGRYDEQWWEVNVGNSLSTLAMACVLTGDRRYLDSVRDWARTSCAYTTWGFGWIDGMDCATGHQLFGLGLVYDWCYDSLDKETLGIIRATLIRRAAAMFNAATKGRIVPDREEYRIHPWPEWDEAYLQNHLWVNTSGLAVAGLALFDEVGEASQWIGFTLDRYGRTMKMLGPDGASHEGINYWSYGIEHLLKFMYCARELLGADMYDNEWFRNTARYRLYTSLPRHAWARGNTAVDYGDSYRKDSYGADYQLRALAGEYRDGYAQWLADELDSADVLFPYTQWLNLIWYDPSVPAQSPSDLPTLFHFTDMDFVSARSDWSGDESFVFFKCGPYIGHKAIQEMVYCPSSAHHTHPDQNHFILFGDGEWLIRDDGNYGKYTGQHNTLLIDGKEQLGGGDSILDAVTLHAKKARPHILRAESTPGLDHITGDATEAYPRNSGLQRFVRHFLFIKPDVLIVADDIVLDNAHDLELRFHPEQQKAEQNDNVFIMRGQQAVLRLDLLTPDGIEMSAEMLEAIRRNYEKDPYYTIMMKTHRNVWRNAVAMSWSKSATRPVTVNLSQDGNNWKFDVEGKTVVLNWSTGTAELK
ncbi:DUF4962 domain-containing protein [bacterium]|nr:DUF4962 domain-containing protein [bacterium]